jgi:hypothetical protein
LECTLVHGASSIAKVDEVISDSEHMSDRKMIQEIDSLIVRRVLTLRVRPDSLPTLHT